MKQWHTPRLTGEIMLKELAPWWLLGMSYIGEKSLIMVTREVRVMVSIVFSINWLVVG